MEPVAERFAHSMAVRCSALVLAALTPAALTAQHACRADGRLMNVRELPEASGVAVSRRSPGVLWSHNDSGDPELVAVTTEGTTRGRIRIAGARMVDWEDIDVAPCPHGTCVYIGDIGDNRARRRALTIYRVPEPDPEAETSTQAEAMEVTYPDRPQDAEALVAMPNGRLLIVTKGEHGPVALYRTTEAFKSGATVPLERVATIVEANRNQRVADRNRVTGASASVDGRWIVLRSSSAVSFYRADDLEAGRVREAFRSDVRSIGEAQGEGVAFGDHGTVWLASEGGGKSRPGTIAKLICALD